MDTFISKNKPISGFDRELDGDFFPLLALYVCMQATAYEAFILKLKEGSCCYLP